MKILGIDPGSIVCGYGIISTESKSLTVLEYGVVKVSLKNNSLEYRIKEIYERLTQVINRNSPDAAAFETIFFSKNVKSLIKLSHARASAILAVVMSGIPIFEYSPREVKQSVTGRGNASKEQVQFMVKKLLSIKETPNLFDVTDALGVAICHSFRYKQKVQKITSWKDYIEANPSKIINT